MGIICIHWLGCAAARPPNFVLQKPTQQLKRFDSRRRLLRGNVNLLQPIHHISSELNAEDPTLTVDARQSTETTEYTKSKWAHAFASFSLDHQVQNKYEKAIEPLREEARSMLRTSRSTKREKLVLINTLERLGVAHHFDQEIEEILEKIFVAHTNNEDEGDDLFITSLQFRLLRQHRYHASSDVFNKFKGKDNKFRETLESDADGNLSLYEAAHLRIHGEEILDEAVAFTKHNLKRMVRNLESPLQDQVKRALEQPLHRGCPKVESLRYISFYQQEESMNQTLLNLAKLDFNHLQNIYKKELCELSRWWDELKSELSYARSRVVETYLWGMTFNSKPQYSYVRMAVAKMSLLITIIDDTYDNYATIEEADLFTKAVQRWGIEEIDQLPDYMKIVYNSILRVYDDYESEAAERGKLFAVPCAKETLKEICMAYNKEMKWFTRSVPMPSFEDYIATRTISSLLYVICAGTIPGIPSASIETVNWLQSEPKIVKAAGFLCRYLDDLGSYERDSKNGKALTGLDIYAVHHGVSIRETRDQFIELAEDAWKDLNTEWMAVNSVPKDVLELAVGYIRGAEMFCRSCEDGYTKPEIVGGHISALFVDPITII